MTKKHSCFFNFLISLSSYAMSLQDIDNHGSKQLPAFSLNIFLWPLFLWYLFLHSICTNLISMLLAAFLCLLQCILWGLNSQIYFRRKRSSLSLSNTFRSLCGSCSSIQFAQISHIGCTMLSYGCLTFNAFCEYSIPKTISQDRGDQGFPQLPVLLSTILSPLYPLFLFVILFPPSICENLSSGLLAAFLCVSYLQCVLRVVNSQSHPPGHRWSWLFPASHFLLLAAILFSFVTLLSLCGICFSNYLYKLIKLLLSFGSHAFDLSCRC